MTDLLNELIKLAGEQARRMLIHLNQDMMPSWVMIDQEAKIHILGTPWRDDVEKVMVQRSLRQFIKEHQVVAYSFVMEAWAAHKPVGWRPESDPNYQGASKEPNRREIVLAFATNGEEHAFKTWTVQRDWNEQVRALEPMSTHYRGVEGWITTLLEKRT